MDELRSRHGRRGADLDPDKRFRSNLGFGFGGDGSGQVLSSIRSSRAGLAERISEFATTAGDLCGREGRVGVRLTTSVGWRWFFLFDHVHQCRRHAWQGTVSIE